MYIFLDESGDLGFNFEKTKTSRQFVISLLVCQDKQAQDGFRRAVERTLKNKLNHKKNSSRTVAELKGTGATLITPTPSPPPSRGRGYWLLPHLRGKVGMGAGGGSLQEQGRDQGFQPVCG